MMSCPSRFSSLREAQSEMEKRIKNACWPVACSLKAASRASTKKPGRIHDKMKSTVYWCPTGQSLDI